MRILPIDNSRYQKQPNFQSCLRRYLPKNVSTDCLKDDIVKTSTNMFREDLNWKFLVKYLLFNMFNEKKVNTYSLAASDGSEAYSFAIFLMSRLPENVYNKFFPIKASDIDPKMVEVANKRRINIHKFEFDIINRQYQINMRDFFEKEDKPVKIENDDIEWTEKKMLSSYAPVDELKQAVQFKQSDILTELNNIEDDGNSIVFCRNVFPYLKEDYIDDVMKAANNNLKTGSLFVTGEFDWKVDITNKLLENGFFKPVAEYNNIFQKL